MRLNRDQARFARVKYLDDYRTDNCNHIHLGFCFEAPDDMLSVSMFFHQAHLWPLEKPYKPPADLLPDIKSPSAVPSSSIIAMIVL
jgi:hypothetical protein